MPGLSRPVLSPRLFRTLCLLTALANAGGNLFLFFCYEPVFELFGVPMPSDLQSFHFVCGFSFTVGVLAFMAWRSPETSTDLLVVAIIGKAIYAAITGYYHCEHGAHWFHKIFGVWDAAYVVIFYLWLIQLTSPDLGAFNAGKVRGGTARKGGGRALLVSWSMTGNGARAMTQVRRGLERKGYAVDVKAVEPVEALYTFPLSFGRFLRILVRAIFRLRGPAKPLDVADPDAYDLVVVNGQTWFLAPGAPIEDVIKSPDNARLFRGRDVATIADLSGPPNYWDEATIRHNVLEKYAMDQIIGTGFDRESIMLYAFPANWTVGGPGTDFNQDLSKIDREFVGSTQMYPGIAPQIEELPVLKARAAAISSPGEQDTYKFVVPTAGDYVIETAGASDVVMFLYGPDAPTKLVAQNDDAGVGNNARITAALQPGTYFVQVRHYSDLGTGPYRIWVAN